MVVDMTICMVCATPEFHDTLIILRFRKDGFYYREAKDRQSELNAWFNLHGFSIDIDSLQE